VRHHAKYDAGYKVEAKAEVVTTRKPQMPAGRERASVAVNSLVYTESLPGGRHLTRQSEARVRVQRAT